MPTIKHTRDSIEKLEQERNDYKKQRDSLIKDVEKLREENDSLEALSLEMSLDATRYSVLTNHIKDKALHNPSVHRYIDLVHFIDDLERD